MRTGVLYVVFAALSTVTNLGSQVIVQHLYTGPFALVVAVIVGTGVGVVTKYLLDKRFIFRFEVKSIKHQARTLGLYTLMSGVTTLVFWAFEFGAFYLFGTDLAKYSGAVIGLALGYLIKYQLDKNITFKADTTGVNTL
ncbi:GtrA family protein [Subtercola boreus]|uniref:GtrA/DPMS transmembrane domain-containing protein n=1 Tax=Subtercola boreus TaxID=120213 RepID=A0A3E0WCK8_9MICO|nr:GtrA family protein [Subtercola boreus]RFA22551.1 hypothetical protein B7R24_02690 [Subtercola boreus]RFA22907.1 hypothetical protein B7R23_02685 [Subtercola boreus]RFA28658.1 hypothetical protein B7R25_02700 [Subtercola boreus]